MQTRITFHLLRKAIEASLVCPNTRDALEHIARLVPIRSGPQVELLEAVLFVDQSIWRFRTCTDARRFAEMLEAYFRNFDSEYRIRALEQSAETTAHVRFL